MRIFTTLAFILIIFSLASCKSTEAGISTTPQPEPAKVGLSGERFTSPDGYYSFTLPDEWELTEEASGFVRISAPSSDGYVPNLVTSQAEGKTVLEFWSATFQDAIIPTMEGYSLISEEFFHTDSEDIYFRWESTSTQLGLMYHHVFYTFESGAWKLVILYTRLEDAGAEWDDAVDASMRSVLFSR